MTENKRYSGSDFDFSGHTTSPRPMRIFCTASQWRYKTSHFYGLWPSACGITWRHQNNVCHKMTNIIMLTNCWLATSLSEVF